MQEGDILVEMNSINMRSMSHAEVVQVLKDCPWGREATITVQRGGMVSTPTKSKWKKSAKDPSAESSSSSSTSPRKPPLGAGLFRSKTPTADLYR